MGKMGGQLLPVWKREAEQIILMVVLRNTSWMHKLIAIIECDKTLDSETSFSANMSRQKYQVT